MNCPGFANTNFHNQLSMQSSSNIISLALPAAASFPSFSLSVSLTSSYFSRTSCKKSSGSTKISYNISSGNPLPSRRPLNILLFTAFLTGLGKSSDISMLRHPDMLEKVWYTGFSVSFPLVSPKRKPQDSKLRKMTRTTICWSNGVCEKSASKKFDASWSTLDHNILYSIWQSQLMISL